MACLSRSEREVLRAAMERLISVMEADNLSADERRVLVVVVLVVVVLVVVVFVVVLLVEVLSILYRR